MPLIELSDAVEVVDGYKRRNPDSWSLCNSIRRDIGELPTITPDEVRGVREWISNHDGSWNCSECGLRVLICAKGHFCPNCGARMEVREDA